MKKPHEILAVIRKQIFSDDFKTSCRSKPQDFTRNCLINIPLLISFVLNQIRRSLQVELINSETILKLRAISKQALSSARQKLLPEAFKILNRTLVHEYYTNNYFRIFMGFRLIGIDGSALQLPEIDSIKKKYGVSKNQNGENPIPQARISHAYDLLSGITLDAIISPYATSERSNAYEHILNICNADGAKDLYIFDRGYPSLTLIFLLLHQGKDFLVRCKNNWLKEFSILRNDGKIDGIIELNFQKRLSSGQRETLKKLLPKAILNKIFRIRVVFVKLANGEEEVLITSLLDQNKYKYEIFSILYNLRWGIEESYKIHKVRHEIENFCGETTKGIEQEFYATIFTENVRVLIAEEALQEIKNENQVKKLRYEYKINNNVSIGILKNELMRAMFTEDICLESFCEVMKNKMKRALIPIRKGRKYRRIKKSTHRKKRHRNLRRAL